MLWSRIKQKTPAPSRELTGIINVLRGFIFLEQAFTGDQHLQVIKPEKIAGSVLLQRGLAGSTILTIIWPTARSRDYLLGRAWPNCNNLAGLCL